MLRVKEEYQEFREVKQQELLQEAK